MTDRSSVLLFTVMLVVVALAPMSQAQQSQAQQQEQQQEQQQAQQQAQQQEQQQEQQQTQPKQILKDEDDDAQAAARKDLIPELIEGHFRLPPMFAPTIGTDDIGNGRVPDGFRGSEEKPLEPLPESPRQRGEEWDSTVCSWAAPNTFSNPRYFEDRMLERHGHRRFGHLQPFASGARFFATVPMLPYLMTVREPCDCEYTLGYYRPGSCTPVMMQRPPIDRAAIIVESAAIAGAIIAIP